MPAPDTRRAALAQTRLQSELWHARQQSAQLCRELRALSTAEPRPAAPRHDLAFLMPGHSLWVWEAYDAPELAPAELEHFLRAHNANAARRPAPPAVAVDAWLAAQRASRAPFERAPQMLQKRAQHGVRAQLRVQAVLHAAQRRAGLAPTRFEK